MKARQILFALPLMLMSIMAFQPHPDSKGKTAKKAPQKEYAVKFNKTIHDFGILKQGIHVEASFRLINTGKKAIYIEDVITFEGWVPQRYSTDSIRPGKYSDITVGFNTAGRSGVNNKQITVRTTAGNHFLTIKYKIADENQGVDPIHLSNLDYEVKFNKIFHDFGDIQEGDIAETSFILTNIGRSPVEIEQCDTYGGHTTASFSMEPIMPGKSATIKIAFNTNGKNGINYKLVTVRTNAGMHELNFRCYVTQRIKSELLEPQKINSK